MVKKNYTLTYIRKCFEGHISVLFVPADRYIHKTAVQCSPIFHEGHILKKVCIAKKLCIISITLTNPLICPNVHAFVHIPCHIYVYYTQYTKYYVILFLVT